jgi:hypothetical protein
MSTAFEGGANRRRFIGGSDARIIMGDNDGALVRLWQAKRSEADPLDLFWSPNRKPGISDRPHSAGTDHSAEPVQTAEL